MGAKALRWGEGMRNIAIVEDEDDAASVLEDYIGQFSAETGQAFKVERFRDALTFLTDYQSKYAVVLMDIQMPGRDGMSAAVELRKSDKSVSVIFISNLIQYAQKGYEVNAVAYILKPVQYYDFALKFRKALDIYVLNEKQDFVLNTAEGLCRISTDKLVYVETMRHRLYYHTVDEVIERTGVLSQVEEELRKFGFLRCSQSYLVNPRFIVGVRGGEVRLGAETIPISRPRKKAFMEELANWYAGLEERK